MFSKFKTLYFAAGAVALAGALMLACSGKSDEKKEDTNQDDDTTKIETVSPDVNSSTPATPVLISEETTKPAECIIVFDASSSMKGYVDATVNGVFPDVISSLNNSGQQSHAYLFDTKKTPIANFVSKIQHKDISWANESDLFGMVSEIFNSANANPNNCYALVTDGIMSGTNAEIKADPTYNISKPGILKGKIDSIISHQPGGNDITMLVATYSAPFKGVYYKYNNDKATLENKPRPFYVLVAGKSAQINYVKNELAQHHPEGMVEYGVIYPMSISTSAKMAGGGKYKLDKSVTDGLNFIINLEKLPAYAKNVSYLNSNLEIVKQNPKGNKTTLKPAIGETEGDYTIEINGNRAVITPSEKIARTIPATFNFKLKRAQPQWVEDMTTHNDITGYRPNATLNLDYFLAPFVKMNNAQYLNDTEKAKIEIIK